MLVRKLECCFLSNVCSAKITRLHVQPLYANHLRGPVSNANCIVQPMHVEARSKIVIVVLILAARTFIINW